MSTASRGAVVEAAGGLALVAQPLNPGEFDYRAYLRGQGIRLRFSVDDPSGLWAAQSGTRLSLRDHWSRLIGFVRGWSQKTLAGVFSPTTAPLASALLLGRREGVDPDVNDAFARTGTTHLLAISGLHMQVLAVALGFLLRACGVGRRKTFATVIMATVGYTILVGFMPSVVRSATMTIAACTAGLVDRQNHNANTFSLAAIATLAHNPADLFDVGCQLSFLAVAAIVWMVGPVLAMFKPKPDPLRDVEEKLATGWRGVGAACPKAVDRSRRCFGHCLAGRLASDCLAVSPRRADQHRAQSPTDPDDLRSAPGVWSFAGLVRHLEAAGNACGLGGVLAAGLDRTLRPLGC